MENKELYFDNEKEIKDLLLYRKIIKVDENTLYLDNGIELEVIPNSGCGGCESGWYDITELNSCDNAITNVEFNTEDDIDNNTTSYKIFVFAEDTRIKILQVDGTDGNGYYGTGYSIIVKQNKGNKNSISQLNLSEKTEKILLNHNINTLDDLKKISSTDIIKFYNFGRKSLEELLKKMKEHNISFIN